MKRQKLKQLEREIADREAKARVDSDERQQKIKRLWDLKAQDLKAKTYKERNFKEQELKERKLRRLQDCFKLLASKEVPELEELVDELREEAGPTYAGLPPWQEICESVNWLADLARTQDRQIEYFAALERDLERIRKFYPRELENLSGASLTADLRPLLEKQFRETGKKDAKKEWERTKRRSSFGWLHSIEYQFGGAGEAAWRESSFSVLSGRPYEPTCLRKILSGSPINMRELQDLFWPLRPDRFPKDLPSERNGRQILYPLCALVMAMEAFLNEKPKVRKRAGGKARRVWLRDPKDVGLRIRVLRKMEAYIQSIASELWETSPDIAQEWQTEIADPILAVIDRYLRNSAE